MPIRINNKNSNKIKYKTRKISLSLKLLLPTLLTSTLLSVILCYVSYNDKKKSLIKDVIATSRMLATIGSSMINGDHLSYIRSEKDTQKVIYDQLANKLKMINTSGALKYIYTVYFEDNKIYYGVDIEQNTATACLPGQAFEASKSNIEYKTLQKGSIYSDKNITKFNDDNLITALAPIYDSHDNLVGAIGCDYDADVIIKELNSTLVKLVIIAIVAIVVSSALLIILSK